MILCKLLQISNICCLTYSISYIDIQTYLLVDRTTHIKNLQRKIKNLKDQLDSKDLHMDLLRKKVTTLEERLAGRSELEREKVKIIIHATILSWKSN